MRRGGLVQSFVGVLLAGLSLAAACGPQGLSILPGIINDPANRSLRKALLGYVTDNLCQEVQGRSVPLRLRRDDPATGRFFATACRAERSPRDQLVVTLDGHGYAWTNVTGRVGFRAAATVRYDHDFRIVEDRMYVYFRQRQTYQTRFEPTVVTGGAHGVLGAGVHATLGTTMQVAVKQLGGRILREQIAQGFTVIRESSGGVRVVFGLVEAGTQPLVPFAYRGEGLRFNDRSELHQGQRDYLGPITIERAEQQLHMDARLEGAAAVDVLLVPQSVVKPWLAAYEGQPRATPPPAAVPIDDVLPASRNSGVWRRAWDVPRGVYFIVLDHTIAAGRTSLPQARLDDRAALVSYAVRVVEP